MQAKLANLSMKHDVGMLSCILLYVYTHFMLDCLYNYLEVLHLCLQKMMLLTTVMCNLRTKGIVELETFPHVVPLHKLLRVIQCISDIIKHSSTLLHIFS